MQNGDHDFVDVTGVEDPPPTGQPALNRNVKIERIRQERNNPDTGEHEYRKLNF